MFVRSLRRSASPPLRVSPRRPLVIAVAAATVASGFVVSSASAQPPALISPAQVDRVTSAPDELSAMSAARRQNSPVQIDDSLTADAVTIANPDGSLTLQQSSGPVRVKQSDGSWADVDLSWQAVNGQVTERMPATAVTLSGGGDATIASSPAGSGVVSLGWDGPLPTPSLSGTTATYPNVRPDVDLVVQALRSGYEVNFVVRSRPTADLSLPLTMDLRGLAASRAADGSIQVTDSKGVVRARSAVPVMFDAAIDPTSHLPSRSQKVADSLSAATAVATAAGATGQTWSLQPDTSFLSDPATTYPVTVDPTFAINPSSDTWVKSDVSVSEYNNVDLWVGTPDAGVTKARSYFHNNAIPSQISGMYIDSANLGLYNVYSASCSVQPVTLYRMLSSSSWTSQTVWSTKPNPDTSSSWSGTFSNASNSCPGAAWASIPITSLVQDWASGANTIRDWEIAASETATIGWKEFYSADAPDHIPYVSITYRGYPGTPGTPTMRPTLGAGPSGFWTPTATPTLSSTVSSSSGTSVQGLFKIYNGGTLVTSTYGNTLTGAGTSVTTVPSSAALQANVLYTVRVNGISGGAQSASWSNYIQFKIDDSAPMISGIASTEFPSGVWTTGQTSGAFAVSASDTSSGIDHYLWSLDSPSPVNGTTSSTINLDPMPGGWHTLYVAAVDKAGNRSSTATYSFGAGSAVTTPADGAVAQQLVVVTSQAAPTGGIGQVTYYYRRAEADTWATLPTSDVTVTSSGPGFSGWPYTYSSLDTTGIPASLTWNAANSMSGVDGPLQLAVCFGSTTYCPSSPGASLPSAASSPHQITLDQLGLSNSASSSLPIGRANLATGNYQLDTTDVSVPGNLGDTLTVGRTFNSALSNTSGRNGAPSSGIFGPGWSASLAIPTAGADWVALTDTGNVLAAVGSDESTTNFAMNGAGAFSPTGEAADSGLLVSANTSRVGCRPLTDYYRCYDLTDLDGDTVVFRSVAGGTSGTLPAATGTLALPVTYQTWQAMGPSSQDTTIFTYAGSGLVSQILSPLPYATANCTDVGSGATWSPGCRALGFTYNGSGEVTSITFETSDGTNPLLVDVACYAYDSTSHKLTDEWDPRNVNTYSSGNHPISCGTPVRPSHYGYDTSGRIIAIRPAYQSGSTPIVGWSVGYDTSGRASTVTRAHTDSSGSEVTAVYYGVPVGADSSNPSYRPDMGASAVATWAQTDVPDANLGGVAICPAGSAGTSNVGSLTDCTITYLDGYGREVNTASYSGTGASGWHIDTTEYDALGHIVRTLSASNREESLNPGGAAGTALSLPADSAAASITLSSLYEYAPNQVDGQPDLVTSFGPYHLVGLPDGSTVDARSYTSTIYDNSTGDPFAVSGSEPGHPTGAGNSIVSFHLPVRATSGASVSPDAVVVGLTDTRTTDSKYYSGTDYTGWIYRSPMQTVVDPSGLGVTRTVLYDAATGRTSYSRQPSASGDTSNSSAGTTHYIYYTQGTNADDASCGNKSLWAGFLCKRTPASTNPTWYPALPVIWYKTYDYLARATEVDQTSSSAPSDPQVTSTGFGFGDSATASTLGNPFATTVERSSTYDGGTDPTSPAGIATPVAHYTYDLTTGLQTGVTDGEEGDVLTYDNFGRLVTYTDNNANGGALANTTTTSYDPTHGWITTVTDAHSTISYSYNQGVEHRSVPTQQTVTVASSSVGSYTAGYDADGRVVTQTDPNGVTQTTSFNEAAEPYGLSYVKSGSSWLQSEDLKLSIRGQRLASSGTSGVRLQTYDAAGRVTQAQDTPLTGQCVTRAYTFDSDSNRLSASTYPAASPLTGNCQAGTGGTTLTHSYDAADRLLPSGSGLGTTYDVLSRTTTVGSADTHNALAASVSYYANGFMHTLHQVVSANTVDESWSLDGRMRLWEKSISVAGGSPTVTTNHYDSPATDSPSWTTDSTDGSQWTAQISGISGTLAALVNQSHTVTYQYLDLGGSVIATGTAGALTPTYDEYGIGSGSNVKFGWKGGAERIGDTGPGFVLMGVRLYDPTTGRFLQPDPVTGGSANAYDYANQDPANEQDLRGLWASEEYQGTHGAAALPKPPPPAQPAPALQPAPRPAPPPNPKPSSPAPSHTTTKPPPHRTQPAPLPTPPAYKVLTSGGAPCTWGVLCTSYLSDYGAAAMLGGVSIAVGSWGYCAGPEGIAAMTGEEFEASATCVAGTIAGAGTAGVGALLMTVGALFNF